MPMRPLLTALAFAAAVCASWAGDGFPTTPGTHTIRFTRSAVQSSAEEVKARLSAAEQPGPFTIGREEFRLIIPENYRREEAWGLFIWISASHSADIPPAWQKVLAARKLLFVGALQSGNPRSIFDRMRLAIDANVGLREQYKIDGGRVYLAGFSGGARVASMLGVAYADLFPGTMPFMGVNFYTELPMPDGKPLGISYLPDDEVVEIAKKRCRYVLVTGEKDFNRANTQAAYEHGFRKEGFAHVHYLEAPALAHSLPGPEWLERGLAWLDAPENR